MKIKASVTSCMEVGGEQIHILWRNFDWQDLVADDNHLDQYDRLLRLNMIIN